MGEIDRFAAGIDDNEQALEAEIGNHEVVNDAARLGGQQRVALPPGPEAADVAAHQTFQRLRRTVAGQHGLAHMRDVEQSGMGPAMQMFGHDAAFATGRQFIFEVVLHRHGIAGKRHHPRTMMAMPVG